MEVTTFISMLLTTKLSSRININKHLLSFMSSKKIYLCKSFSLEYISLKNTDKILFNHFYLFIFLVVFQDFLSLVVFYIKLVWKHFLHLLVIFKGILKMLFFSLKSSGTCFLYLRCFLYREVLNICKFKLWSIHDIPMDRASVYCLTIE